MQLLEGTVERITFRSDETLYTVARFKVGRREGPVTVVGSFPSINVGESLRLEGEWITHPEYGRQFKVNKIETMIPATVNGLERYLGSGLVKGIGPKTAKKLVERFGLDILDIIEHEPRRLTELSGISVSKAERIQSAFLEQKEMKDVLVYLQGHGISATYAVKIYKHYRDQTMAIVQQNPYRLADEVFGIGFKTADKIAQQLGVDPSSPHRLASGLQYVLGELANDGHTYVPEAELLSQAAENLEVEAHLLQEPLLQLAEKRQVFIEPDLHEQRVYLAPFFYAEAGVARLLRVLAMGQMQSTQLSLGGLERMVEEEIDQAERVQGITFAPEQRQALRQALNSGVVVITGGPGTGKTTIVRALLELYQLRGAKVLLAAPTGRAAKRMTEATGRPAKTIHRLLEYSFVAGEGMNFARNEQNPLEADVVILDEVSMVDLLLMYSFLKALPPSCRLVLVGDRDQLPSVGAGNVLKDIIDSETIPTVTLKTIFRQAQESMIVVNAHRINEGEFPLLNERQADFFFMEEETPEKALPLILNLCARRLPNYTKVDPLDGIQVLAPMRRGAVGVETLNHELQQALNPADGRKKPELRVAGTVYRLGDKVMQIRNNYQKNVFNGDIGRITQIDNEEGELTVDYPEAEGIHRVSYELTELDELVLSYAVSVHKSQGSEYPVVVMPVMTQHFMMLQRNLLYTGITRAKRLVVLVGSKKALAIAVNNNRVADRYSRLAERLRG